MAFKVDASFENGVFVPTQRPGLSERERVRLTIEPVADLQADSKDSSEGESLIKFGSQTGVAVALDYHPDGC
jgi:hypothetical protein